MKRGTLYNNFTRIDLICDDPSLQPLWEPGGQATRQWMCRWRRRHGGWIVKLRCREYHSTETKRSKAGAGAMGVPQEAGAGGNMGPGVVETQHVWNRVSVPGRLDQFVVPVLGTIFDSPNGNRFLRSLLYVE